MFLSNINFELNKSTSLLLVALIIMSFSLYWARVVPISVALAGLAIIWVAALPTVFYLQSVNQKPIPFFELNTLFYLVFFGLPVFTIPLAWPQASNLVINDRSLLPEIRTEVVVTVFFGIAIMACSFYLFRNILFKSISHLRIVGAGGHRKAKLLIWVLMGAHLIYLYVPGLSNIGSIGQFLNPISYVAFGAFYLFWRNRQLSQLEFLVVILICLPLEIYARIESLQLAKILLFGIFFVIIFWREKQYILLAMLSVFCLLAILSYGTTIVVRSYSVPGVDRILAGIKFFTPQLILGKKKILHRDGHSLRFDGRFGAVVKRTAKIWTYHIVANKSPNPIPLWRGESYKPLITSFIPRIFYPDKPEERAGNVFGKRYGFLDSNNTNTAINISWNTELLANFGSWGVLWGMALIGAFLALLDRIFNSRKSSDLEFIVGLSIISPLVYPESNLSVMIGSMLPLTICLYVYFRGGAWVLNKLPVKFFKSSSIPRAPT
jgi:hypothetical protein